MRQINLLLFMVTVVIILNSANLFAQVDLTATAGTNAGSYPTLKAAFDAVNAGTHQGVIAITVNSNTTETATAVLNANGSGSAVYTSVSIQPTGGIPATITGAIAGPIIDLNGADNVTIDGLNSGGNSLTISNTLAGSASTIRLINDASNNTVQNCSLLGSTTSGVMGTVFFSTGTTTGNNNNNFSNNNIGPAGSNYPINGVYSVGTSASVANSTNTFNANNIYDYFNATSNCSGLYLNTPGNNAWTITNNRFYQTDTRIYTSATNQTSIQILSGAGYSITGNVIGFANSSGTGTTNLIGNSFALTGTFPSSFTATGTSNTTSFSGIRLALNALGTVSEVQNNTIAGFAFYTGNATTTAGGAWCGINITSGNVNIGTTTGNIIGSISGKASVYLASAVASGSLFGIYVSSNDLVNIKNNTIGGIEISGGSATLCPSFYGIDVAGTGAFIITNNIVGNASADNIRLGLILISSNLSNDAANSTMLSTSSVLNFFGIRTLGTGTARMSNNTLQGWITSGTAVTVAGFTSGANLVSVTADSNTIGSASFGWIKFTSANTPRIIAVDLFLSTTGLYNSIQNNDIRGISLNTTASMPATLLSIASASGANNVSIVQNNTFTNLTFNSTGNVIFISLAYNVSSTGTLTVNNNSIVTGFNKTGAGGSVTITQINTPSVGAVVTHTNNNFSNITVTGATTISGYSANNATITGNTFSNWTCGSGTVTVLQTLLSTMPVANNTISNITGTGTLTGISVTGGTGNASVYNNTVTGLSTSASISAGIFIQPGSGNIYIYKNKIAGLNSTSAGASDAVRGLYVNSGNDMKLFIYNNYIGNISMPAGTGAVTNVGAAGIVLTSAATGFAKLYNNTVYLNETATGAHSSACIYHSANASTGINTLDLQNNVLVNNSTAFGTGKVMVLQRTAATTGTLANFQYSNNNCFYAGTPGASNLMYYDGTNSVQTLAQYKSFSSVAGNIAARDAQTITENPTWASTTLSDPTYLHIDTGIPSLLESSGTPLALVTDDFDGNNRNSTTPDIGADEFTGTPAVTDIIAPSISNQNITDLVLASTVSFTGVSITDVSGINTTSGTRPRVYYKKSGDANAYAGNTSADDGWKWVEATGTTSPFSFTIDYSKLRSAVTNVDSINYFVVAQDNAGTPNVGVNAGSFGSAPTSVDVSSNFPVTGFRNYKPGNNYTVGTGGNFTTLFNAFTAINSGVITGAITLSIISNITETSASSLLASGSGGANYSSVLIQPSGGAARTISGAINTGLIALYGADNVTIDGLNTGGNTLTIQNSSTTASASVVSFLADATNNTLRNTTFAGSNAGASGSGVINFGSGIITGNDGNTINGCNIGPNGANLPIFGILSSGLSSTVDNSGNTISGNNIYDYFSATLASYGINIGSNNTGWTITGNKLYQTSARQYTTATTQSAMLISSGAGYTITGNTIGFANSSGTGTTILIGNTGALTGTFPTAFLRNGTANSTTFRAMNFTFTAGGAVSSIQNNVIGGFALYSNSSNPSGTGVFCGIYVGAGNANIGTVTGNTIGSASGTGSIFVADTISGAATVGISIASPGTVTISNNSIGGIDAVGTSATTSGLIVGIELTAAGTYTIRNNSIGNSTANNMRVGNLVDGSLNISSTGSFQSTTGGGGIIGIRNSFNPPTLTISNNTLQGWATSGTITTITGITTSSNPGYISIDSNNVGNSSPGWVNYAVANSGTLTGISVAGSTSQYNSIQKNNFQGITYGVQGTNANTYISHTGGAASGNSSYISNNTFTNLNVNTTGTITMISYNYAVAGGATLSINNNSIVTGFTKNSAATTGIVYGIKLDGSSTVNSTVNITNNNFSGITVSGSSTIDGINGTAANTGNRVYSGNTFSNWTAGSGLLNGLTISVGGGNGFPGNVISGNTISGFSSSGTINGISLSGGTINSVYGNTISGLSTSAGSTVKGMAISGGTTNYIYKNKIFNLSGSNASSIVQGIHLSGGTTGNIYNNIIGDLRATIGTNAVAPVIYGINIGGIGSGASANLYYNTIRINASSSGATFGTAGIYHTSSTLSNSGALTLKNNLVVNTSTATGTAKTVAFQRSAGAASNLANFVSSSNNNCYYAGTPGTAKVIYFDGTSTLQTIDNYKNGNITAGVISPAENLSVTENTVFQSTTGTDANFLNISTGSASQLESGALPVATITDDFYGNTRSATTPDIGAVEFTGIVSDLTGPSIVYTALGNTGSTSDRTLTATITDYSGVPRSGTGMPVLYWKKTGGSYAGVTGVSLGGSSYSFTFGAGTTVGDVVSYYIVAQDSAASPNVISYPFLVSVVTASPPAASTPTTAPSTYTIIQSLSGNKTVGTGGDYTTLSGTGGLFADINSKSLAGDLTVSVISDISVAATDTISLRAWAEDGAGGYRLVIQPDGTTMRTISGTALPAGKPMINILGASRVTIDGTAGKYLTLVNTNATPANTTPTILFSSGSFSDTIKNCIIQGNGSAAGSGTIFVSSGTNSVVITGNNIGDATTGTPGQHNVAIYSTNGINALNITSNNIFNFTGTGILSVTPADGSIVTGNSFYNTLGSNTSGQTGISFGAGSGHTISNNYIGGQAPNCGGNAWVNSASANLQGISLTNGGTSATSVQNNTIQNFSYSGTSAVIGINTNGGSYNIGTITGNTIGHNTTPNSITSSANGSIIGIQVSGTGTANIANNIIANLTGTNTGTSAQILGISSLVSVLNSVTDNSIHDLQTASTKSLANVIANTVSTSAVIVGIVISSTNSGQLISRNTFYALRSTTTSTATTAVVGIGVDVNCAGVISKNRMYDFTNTTLATGTGGGISGIRIINGNMIVANNQISLTNGSNANNVVAAGIVNNSSLPVGLYYNTIYIGGSLSTGTGTSNAFANVNTNANAVLLNNIFYNERASIGGASGKHYIFSFGTLPLVYNSNYNLTVNTNPATFGLYSSTDNTSALWRTNTNTERNSWVELPSNLSSSNLFTDKSTGNLGINNANAEAWSAFGKGVFIPSQADDYANTSVRSISRATGPTCIGSREFSTPTVTPPAAPASGSPANNVTNTFSLLGRSVGSLTWGGTGTVPTSVALTYHSGVTPPGNLNSGRYYKGYWHFEPTGGSGYTYSVTLNYDTSLVSDISSESLLKIAKRDPDINSGAWVGYSKAIVDVVNKTITLTGLTSFSDFTLYDSNAPVPVELSSFSAIVKERRVELNWVTATEKNTAEFTVEQLSTGNNWFPIASVKAAGVSNSPKEYSFTDNKPNTGKLSYRLKMTDNDGTYQYSKIVEVLIAAPKSFSISQNYPNPFNPSTKIDYQIPGNAFVTAELYSITGQRVATLINSPHSAGYYTLTVDANKLQLASGMYVYRIMVNAPGQQTIVQTKKMILIK